MQKFQVYNYVPNIKVTINENPDGTFAIMLVEQKTDTTLGSVPRGAVAVIGGREYIVLDHSSHTTAVIAKNFVRRMAFGKNKEWVGCDIQRYLNVEFYNELARAVGDHQIITHTVSLVAEDGTGRDKSCKERISLLTYDLYRRYREFLPAYGSRWWLSTRITHLDIESYDNRASCVCADGVVGWNICDDDGIGVRPYVILSSDVKVTTISGEAENANYK